MGLYCIGIYVVDFILVIKKGDVIDKEVRRWGINFFVNKEVLLVYMVLEEFSNILFNMELCI